VAIDEPGDQHSAAVEVGHRFVDRPALRGVVSHKLTAVVRAGVHPRDKAEVEEVEVVVVHREPATLRVSNVFLKIDAD